MAAGTLGAVASAVVNVGAPALSYGIDRAFETFDERAAPMSPNPDTGGYRVGKIVPGEPITDPAVRAALKHMWELSLPNTPGAHEEGVTLKATFHNYERRFLPAERWQPGDTLEEMRKHSSPPGNARRMPPGHGMRQYVFSHSHPWDAGTFMFRDANGVRNLAGEGPSYKDVWSVDFDREVLGWNSTDYVVTPKGVYRILGSENAQWIAPLSYLGVP